MKSFLQILGLVFMLMVSDSAADPVPSAGKQVEQSLEVPGQSRLNYLLYLPKDYDEKESSPLLLFLHGAGERGNDMLGRVKVHGPPKLIDAGEDFPFIVASPQCKEGGWWQSADLSALIDHLESTFHVDRQRIYVTGLSMGGFGTWALALDEPERFAAIAPICGGGNTIAVSYVKPIQAAVWAFHGAKDTVVPLSESQEMAAALRGHGVDVTLTVYPEANHDSWTETYNNKELYKWLLSHSRKKDE